MNHTDHYVDQRRNQLHGIDILHRIAYDSLQSDRLFVPGMPFSVFLGPPFDLFLVQRIHCGSKAVKEHVDQKQRYVKDNTGSRPTIVHFNPFLHTRFVTYTAHQYSCCIIYHLSIG